MELELPGGRPGLVRRELDEDVEVDGLVAQDAKMQIPVCGDRLGYPFRPGVVEDGLRLLLLRGLLGLLSRPR